MSKKIQVEQIPSTLSEAKIEALFKPFGSVLRVKLESSKPGEDSVSAIVEMENGEEAHKAIEKLNGSKCGGKTLRVHKAHGKDHFEKNAGNFFSNKSHAGSGGSAPFRASRGGGRGR